MTRRSQRERGLCPLGRTAWRVGLETSGRLQQAAHAPSLRGRGSRLSSRLWGTRRDSHLADRRDVQTYTKQHPPGSRSHCGDRDREQGGREAGHGHLVAAGGRWVDVRAWRAAWRDRLTRRRTKGHAPRNSAVRQRHPHRRVGAGSAAGPSGGSLGQPGAETGCWAASRGLTRGVRGGPGGRGLPHVSQLLLQRLKLVLQGPNLRLQGQDVSCRAHQPAISTGARPAAALLPHAPMRDALPPSGPRVPLAGPQGGLSNQERTLWPTPPPHAQTPHSCSERRAMSQPHVPHGRPSERLGGATSAAAGTLHTAHSPRGTLARPAPGRV